MPGKYDHLSKEQLVALLEEREKAKRLGLVWERDPALVGRDESVNEQFVTLNHDADASCGSGAQRNLIIEGDNYDALRLLRMTHAGRVKCIYIDPPYNTGNRDFIYNDRFINKEDGWRHSKWIEFMHRRLVLAKELLREDGVIFISIDDNELFHLGMLMNEVFGEKNRLACFAWQTDGNSDNTAKVKICHEYILAYTQNIEAFPSPPIIDESIPETSKLFNDEIRNTIVKNGPKNPISTITLPKGFPAGFDAGIVSARQDKWPRYKTDVLVKDGKLVNSVEAESGWSSKELCEEFIDRDFSPITDAKGQQTTFEIKHSGAIEVVKRRSKSQSHVLSVLRGLGATQTQSNELAAMGVDFSYPKPIKLVQFLIRMVSSDNCIVVDFFAGSGTTGHAVLKLNANDDSDRQFILVSSTEASNEEPKKNLCRNVCAKRVKRVCEGYGDMKGLGGGFAYLRIEKMEPGRLLRRLQHEQVWITLQMMHLDSLTPEAPSGIVWAAGEGKRRLIYLTQTNEKSWGPLERALEENRRATIYTWQPDLVKHHAPKATVRPIPKFLMERLGIQS
jgi:adenine-specific DNA-methyltransferase